MISTRTWADIKNLIKDHIRDTSFISDYQSEVKRAFNMALDAINAGDTGETNMPEVGFEFQKETTDVSYVDGTIDYTFSTLGVTRSTFKFPTDLRVDTDHDVYFSYVEPKYFFRKEGVFESLERMYTITQDASTTTLKINHTDTETLNFEYVTNAMVLDTDGSTRKAYIANTGDKLLIPDQFIEVPLFFTVAKLYGQNKGFSNKEGAWFLNEAQRKLSKMIQSVGIYHKPPTKRIKLRNEWPRTLKKTTND